MEDVPWSFTADLVATVLGRLLPDLTTLENEELTPDQSPDQLLQNVYQVVEEELRNTPLKPQIEGAITAFANPPIYRVSSNGSD